MPEIDSRTLPLTHAQQGVWFSQHLDPTSAKFNISECFELACHVDENAFAEAVSTAVAACPTSDCCRRDRSRPFSSI
jgi:hypothetical protein